jgi:hypothetical protein
VPKSFLYALAGFAAALWVAVLAIWLSQRASVAAEAAPPPPAAASPSSAAPALMDAVSFYREWQTDPAAQEARWRGKRVLLRGTVDETYRRLQDKMFVCLRHAWEPTSDVGKVTVVFRRIGTRIGREIFPGFETRFYEDGSVVLPWSDGQRITVSGLPYPGRGDPSTLVIDDARLE